MAWWRGVARSAMVLAAVLAVTALTAPSPAAAWGYGVNRVQTAAEDSWAQTGMGPGWVLLSYKANGPMVGYLFARDFVFADVWSENKGGGLKTTTARTICGAFGNIGAAAAYGSGPAVAVHPLGTAPAGAQIDIRYVTRDRQWIMAKWHGNRFAAGIAWAFLPRSCVW